MKPLEQSPAPALDRGLCLIRYLAQAPSEGRSYGELAAFLDIANSGLSRLLQVLDHHGWIQKDQEGRYHHQSALDDLIANSPQKCLKRAAPLLLAELAEHTQCTGLLVVREGRSLVHTAKHFHSHGMVMREVGSRLDDWLKHPWAWVIASELTPKHRSELLRPEGTTTLPESIQTMITDFGWAILDEETGQRMAAVICLPNGEPCAAVAIGGTISRKRRQQVGRHLVAIAGQFETALAAKGRV